MNILQEKALISDTMRKKTTHDSKNSTDIAGRRAEFYGIFVIIFERLPDQIFLEQVQGPYFNHLLDSFDKMGSPGFKAGVQHIRNYQSHVSNKSENAILQELSVDRARIFRASVERLDCAKQ